MNNPVSLENQKAQIEIPAIPKPPKRSRDYQQISLYKDVNPLDWEDWHWQLKHRIHTKEELTQIIKLTPEEEKGIDKAKGRLAMAITPYWASLIDAEDIAENVVSANVIGASGRTVEVVFIVAIEHIVDCGSAGKGRGKG